jgi:hypothetical protein
MSEVELVQRLRALFRQLDTDGFGVFETFEIVTAPAAVFSNRLLTQIDIW